MAEKTFRLKVIAPERIFFQGDVEFLEFRTTEGEVGIYPSHLPMTMIIAPGVLKIHNDGDVRQAALLSGFVEVLGNEVNILAESVEWPEEIDENRAREAKIRAERRLKGDDGASVDLHRAELALKRSVVRLNLIKK